MGNICLPDRKQIETSILQTLLQLHHGSLVRTVLLPKYVTRAFTHWRECFDSLSPVSFIAGVQTIAYPF